VRHDGEGGRDELALELLRLAGIRLVVAIPPNRVKETRVEGDRPPASGTDDAQKS